MIQINDIVEYNNEQFSCWFIEEVDGIKYIHLINDTYGICVLENEL